jgi:hypothetical protein
MGSTGPFGPGGCPLTPQQVDEIGLKFKQQFGKEPEGIFLVGSHAEGTATSASDIDIVIETDLSLTKFSGPGFDFFKAINPGKVSPGIAGIGTGPGRALIGPDPGDIPKPGLIDLFFRPAGNVWPPSLRLK